MQWVRKQTDCRQFIEVQLDPDGWMPLLGWRFTLNFEAKSFSGDIPPRAQRLGYLLEGHHLQAQFARLNLEVIETYPADAKAYRHSIMSMLSNSGEQARLGDVFLLSAGDFWLPFYDNHHVLRWGTLLTECFDDLQALFFDQMESGVQKMRRRYDAFMGTIQNLPGGPDRLRMAEAVIINYIQTEHDEQAKHWANNLLSDVRQQRARMS